MIDGDTDGVNATVPQSELQDLQFLLQETRVLFVQQILAHDTGVLSVEELSYRNPDLTEENIRYHLRELADRTVLERHEVPTGERTRDLPNTFFGVTERGLGLLERANLTAEVALWRQVYAAMERTDRIREIEAMEARPVSSVVLPTDDDA